MVVISASILSKSGKVLVARQFIEVSRSRIEGLLAAFPKLLDSGKQHTFIETENVRYVYQPLEELFVVLITTKTSNILEDIDTLHLFARTVGEFCKNIDEEEILNQRFQLIFAFDEIVSLGYKENIIVSQVKTFIEMESHEERVQEMLARSKEQEAREQLKLKIKQIEQQKKDAKKSGRPISGGFGGGHSSYSGAPSPSHERYTSPQIEHEDKPAPSYNSQNQNRPVSKGMQLGKKQGAKDFLEAMKTEDGLEDILDNSEPLPTQKASVTQAPAPSEGIQIIIEEKISVIANRDGGLQNLEIKGDMMLRITDPSKALLHLVVSASDDKSVQFKTHPNVDKKLWTVNSTIGLKEAGRPFPTGQSVGVLKWRQQSKDESMMPLSINCWPSPSSNGSCDVNIEYELENDDLELRDVVILVPLPPGKAPVVTAIDGDHRFNKSHGILEWSLPIIDANSKSGTLEFSIETDDANAFFPIRANFSTNHSLCGVSISNVINPENSQSYPFALVVALSTEEYQIV